METKGIIPQFALHVCTYAWEYITSHPKFLLKSLSQISGKEYRECSSGCPLTCDDVISEGEDMDLSIYARNGLSGYGTTGDHCPEEEEDQGCYCQDGYVRT